MFEVALIGAGTMGQAMLSAWLDSGALAQSDIVISEKDEVRRGEVAGRYGVAQAETVAAAAAGSRVVVLAVKPQDSEPVLGELAGALEAGATLVSIAAGLTIAYIRDKVGAAPTVVRVMPNMAAQVRASVSAFSVDAGEKSAARERVVDLLSAFGQTVEVDEGLMNMVTAVSGSGPAYFFLMVEALEEAGVIGGLDRATASMLARETLWGAAKVLQETGRRAGELREAVSSPGGTTLAALGEFERSGFEDMMRAAVEAASKRAGELAR